MKKLLLFGLVKRRFGECVICVWIVEGLMGGRGIRFNIVLKGKFSGVSD